MDNFEHLQEISEEKEMVEYSIDNIHIEDQQLRNTMSYLRKPLLK